MSPLVVGLSLSPTWLRGDAWRREDSRVDSLLSGEFFIDAAQAAESAGLDFVFKPDALFVDPQSVATSPGFIGPDPVVLMAMLARETSRVGLVPTYSATFAAPYLAARETQTLDHISGGRAGWNVVTSLGGRQNFGGGSDDQDPYEHAAQWISCVRALHASFPADALRLDAQAGVFADASLLTSSASRILRVEGPLSVPSRANRRLPMLHAGQSPASVDLAGRDADAVFGMAPDAESSGIRRSALQAAAVRHGREASAVKFLPGLSLTLADSEEEAQRRAAVMRPGSTSPHHVQHWTVVGTPRGAAREIARRAEAGAIDGVIILPGGSWATLDLLGELMVALTDAGVFKDQGCSGSLWAGGSDRESARSLPPDADGRDNCW